MLNIKFYIRNREYFISNYTKAIVLKIRGLKNTLSYKYLKIKYSIRGRDLEAEIHTDMMNEIGM